MFYLNPIDIRSSVANGPSQ